MQVSIKDAVPVSNTGANGRWSRCRHTETSWYRCKISLWKMLVSTRLKNKIKSILYVKIRTRIKFKSNLSPLFSQIFHVLEPTIILELCNSSLLSSTPHHSLILVYSCYSQHCILGPFAFMGGGRGSEPFRNWCITNSKPFSLFRYGTLTG